VVGKLVLGHTELGLLVGGSRQVIIRTASKDASAGYWARLPPGSHVDLIIPFCSPKDKGWLTPPLAQQEPERAGINSSTGIRPPFGVCNTMHIMPPSRICASGSGQGIVWSGDPRTRSQDDRQDR